MGGPVRPVAVDWTAYFLHCLTEREEEEEEEEERYPR